MERTSINQLIAWKDDPDRLPLIIKGARQVGKTWLMQEFGAKYFAKYAYINFDHNNRMEQLFAGDFNIDRLLQGFSIECGFDIDPESTLIILDEIQYVPEAIHALKYFTEDTRHSYYILAAGSLLGLTLHAGISFPVGKVDTLNLYPLSFTEFLLATGNSSIKKLLDDGDFPMITAFRDKFIYLLKTYYYVGGMPAAVNAYVKNNSFAAARKVHLRLLSNYEADFSKHAPASIVPRVQMVWNGIPSQLAKENKKFIYSVLREGARAKDFELAIQWLLDCGLCHRISRVKKGGFPLKAYLDLHAFKLYMVDIGLLAAMAELDELTLLEGNKIFVEFKGALTEQFVCQQLFSELEAQPYYWSAENSSNEVDFILQHKNKVIPIEVKAEENLKSKSLRFFIDKYELPLGIRTSMADYRNQEWLINLPLYAISQLWNTINNH